MINGHAIEPSQKVDVMSCSERVEPGLFFYPGNGSNLYKAGEEPLIEICVSCVSASEVKLNDRSKRRLVVHSAI